jgi:uncharacterized protein (TIGR02996 family)
MARKKAPTEGDMLLRDVVEHPEDDVPRLIYADWLEEHGTKADAARAEFIRVQCALARLDEDHPRHRDLKQRESELLGSHQDRWLAELPELPGVRWQGFSRGFVDKAFMKNLKAFRTQGEAMFAAAPVETVYFQGLTPKTARELAGLPLLGRVRVLVLAKSDMGDVGLEELFRSPHLANLAQLTVGVQNIGPTGFATLGAANLPGLTKLELNGLGMDDQGARAFAAGANFPRLTHLSLRDNIIGSDGVEALASSPGLAGLVVLDLFGNPVGDRGATALAESPYLPRLASLELYQNSIGIAGASALIGSTRLGSLTRLDIIANPLALGHPARALAGSVIAENTPDRTDLGGSRSLALNLRGNRIDDPTVGILASHPGLGRVAKFDLGYNPIGDQGAAALAASSRLTGLPRLILDQTRIGWPGLLALATSPFLKSLALLDLRQCRFGEGPEGADEPPAGDFVAVPERTAETLDLGENKLTAAALARLAASPALARFRRLVLERNYLDAAGVAALANSLYLTGLHELDLTSNNIGTAGADALANAPVLAGLQTLNLWNAGIGDDGVRALAESAHLAGLTTLILAYNGITDAAVPILVSSPHAARLTALNLLHNNLGPQAREMLRDRFGDRVRLEEGP